MKAQTFKRLTIFRNIAMVMLLVLSVLMIIFGLLSGAEDFGKGIKGILINSPNALPWLALLGCTLLARKKELLGGSIITLMGIASIFAFDTLEDNFGVFLMISLPLILLGSITALHGYFDKKNKGTDGD